MNEKLKNDLEKLGFVNLVKEFKPNYRVAITSSDVDNIVISNNYYNAEDKFDWVKNYPVYCGTCKTIEDFKTIINMVNVEDEVKEFVNKGVK